MRIVRVTDATVSPKGARRWQTGHPWIYRSDVTKRPGDEAGVVRVCGANGRPLGTALWSPKSEISLRLIDKNADARIDADWWRARIAACVARREPLRSRGNAYRLVHGEGDGLPSLICDLYDRWVVVQLMSAGLETQRDQIRERATEASHGTKKLDTQALASVPILAGC